MTLAAGRPSFAFAVGHRDVWRIALPATIAFITEPLAGLTDLTVIGRLGEADLMAGLVLAALAFDFVIAFFFFLRLGTAGLVAQSVGARDPAGGLIHFARAVAIGLGFGLMFILLGLPLQKASALFLAPAPGALPAFETYLSIRLWSAPFVLVNFALLGWFYGRAEATTGMALQMLVHVGNIVMSIGFVYGLGWGVAGVALGTLIAQAVSTLTGLVVVARRAGSFKALVSALPLAALLDTAALRRLFGLSRDLMIRSAALNSAFAFFIAQASREGTVLLAASALVLNFQMVTAFFLDGQAQAAEQLCGKAVGANYRPAFETALRLAMGWGFLISLGLFVFWLIFGPTLIDLMTTATEVRAAARDYLFIAAFTALSGVMPFVMDGVMQGATLNTIMRNGMVSALLIFLVAALVLQPLFGLNGLWVALHIFFLSRGLIYWLAVRGKLPALFSQA